MPYSQPKVKHLLEAFTSTLAVSLERASLAKLSQCIVLLLRQVSSDDATEEKFAHSVVEFASPFSSYVKEGEGSEEFISKSITIVGSISKKVYECSSDKVRAGHNHFRYPRGFSSK